MHNCDTNLNNIFETIKAKMFLCSQIEILCVYLKSVFKCQISNVLQGKCLVANKHFQPDDVILREEPFVSCQFSWNSYYGYRACSHCLW